MPEIKRMEPLSMRGVIAIHQELQARYGRGSLEVDMAQLDLALMRAVKFACDGKRTMRSRLGAGYAWALLSMRPFAEGNESVALAAMLAYLEMNRLTWNCGEAEETAMVLRASAKEIKEDEWEAWVVRNVGKRTP
jgi:prophage maintenance system killer protein